MSRKVPTFADKCGDDSKRSQRVTAVDTVGTGAAASAGGTTYVTNTEDVHKVKGQNFWVMTYAAPEGTRVRARSTFVKCSGAFETEEAAEEQARTIRDENPLFDVSVCSMYQLGQVPPSRESDPLRRKRYADSRLDKIIQGQQASIKQSAAEIKARMERDKLEAEKEMRKRYGADYVPTGAPANVKQYETEREEADARTSTTSYSHRDVIESFARFMQGNPGAIDPSAAASFLRYMHAEKTVNCTGDAAPAEKPDSGEK